MVLQGFGHFAKFIPIVLQCFARCLASKTHMFAVGWDPYESLLYRADIGLGGLYREYI